MVGVVRVDHQHDARARSLANGACHRGIFLDTEANFELHCLEALGDVIFRLLGQVLKRIPDLRRYSPVA